MNKTWTSGAIELLGHAGGHVKLDTAFDKRIAFISIDNAVEITVKTYLSLPKQFFGVDKPPKKELDDCNSSFTNFLSLLFKYANNKLIGIDPGDIEHYHRIRNTLYHDGTGLAVDQEYLNAYFILAKLLLKRLFNIDFQEHQEEASLEKLILNWNHIEEYLAEVFETGLVRAGKYQWIDAIDKGLLSRNLVTRVTHLRSQRNNIVHSKVINNNELIKTFNESKSVLEELKKQVTVNRDFIDSKNFFFEPSISEIKGLLTINSFYGPPNYGDTPDQDKIERVWILVLENPINVHQLKPDLDEGDSNSTQYNIDRIQLSVGKHNNELEKYKGKEITLKGTFWGANTGHHFTPVLMNVITIMK